VTFATFRRGRVIRLPRAALIVMLPAGVIARSWTLAERGATPGQRLVGLRVVDASTGQNLPFRRALVRTAVAQAPSLARIGFEAQRSDDQRSWRRRSREEMAALHERAGELRDQYADDPAALSKALTGL